MPRCWKYAISRTGQLNNSGARSWLVINKTVKPCARLSTARGSCLCNISCIQAKYSSSSIMHRIKTHKTHVTLDFRREILSRGFCPGGICLQDYVWGEGCCPFPIRPEDFWIRTPTSIISCSLSWAKVMLTPNFINLSAAIRELSHYQRNKKSELMLMRRETASV